MHCVPATSDKYADITIRDKLHASDVKKKR